MCLTLLPWLSAHVSPLSTQESRALHLQHLLQLYREDTTYQSKRGDDARRFGVSGGAAPLIRVELIVKLFPSPSSTSISAGLGLDTSSEENGRKASKRTGGLVVHYHNRDILGHDRVWRAE